MSATPAPSSPSSGSAPRYGRSTRCSSPTTPATATGPARCSPARRCGRWWTASPRATCCATATRCCPATWATRRSAMRSCTPSPASGAENPRAVYCCDPVIGDVDEGVYVRPGIEAFLRDHALPQADIATPNRFELERLTAPALHLAGRRRSRRQPGWPACCARTGLRCVLLTSLDSADTPATTWTCWWPRPGGSTCCARRACRWR